MNNYRLMVDIEPTDKYDKAKQKLLQAINAVQELPQYQQQHLAEEIFGATNVAFFLKVLNQNFR